MYIRTGNVQMLWPHCLFDQRRFFKLCNICDIPSYIYKFFGIMNNTYSKLCSFRWRIIICIPDTFNLATVLIHCLLHTWAVVLSYWQYQHTVRSQPTAVFQLLLNVNCLAIAFWLAASFEQTLCYNKFANYMPSILTLNY